jgi:hypothetical protein
MLIASNPRARQNAMQCSAIFGTVAGVVPPELATPALLNADFRKVQIPLNSEV